MELKLPGYILFICRELEYTGHLNMSQLLFGIFLKMYRTKMCFLSHVSICIFFYYRI